MQRTYYTARNVILPLGSERFSLQKGEGKSAYPGRVPAKKRPSRHLLCVELNEFFLQIHNSEISIVMPRPVWL